MLRSAMSATMLAVVVGCDTDHATAPNVATLPAAEDAATSTKTRSVTPFIVSLLNECYNPPVGETVQISGNVVRSVLDLTVPDQRLMANIKIRFEDVTGVGLTSGITYRVHSIDYTRAVFSSRPFVLSEITTLRLIGGGPGSNMLLTSVFRVIVDDFGAIQFFLSKDKVTCSGREA